MKQTQDNKMTDYDKAIIHAVEDIQMMPDDNWPDAISDFAVEIADRFDMDTDVVAEHIENNL